MDFPLLSPVPLPEHTHKKYRMLSAPLLKVTNFQWFHVNPVVGKKLKS